MIKLFVFISLFFVLNSFCQEHKFLPDNDLWKEDSLYGDRSYDRQKMFNDIIDAGQALYNPVAQQNDETLTIKKLWDDPTVNASTQRLWGVTIKMYGGLARREEINPEGFALVLCHELGHAYGGIPYISAYNELSAEGQSDYYSAGVCAKELLKKLEFEQSLSTITQYMLTSCGSRYSGEMYSICVRTLNGGQSLGNLLAVIKKEAIPNYETPDTTVVSTTALSYPKKVQCRLDTYFRGALNLPRPACWFKN